MTITGIDGVNDLLNKVAPNVATNLMRSTVHGMAAEVAKDAKSFMSVDTGAMKRATKTKRERVKSGRARSTVRVSGDAFYWRFREYGQGPDGVEDAMFMKASALMQANMHERFLKIFGKKFEATLARARKKLA
jgi:HK97 gp10 family phage protein